MLLFRASCMHRKFQLQDLWSCALVWWCQKHHPTLHTHTHIILSQLFTHNLSLHTTLFSQATPSWTKNDVHLLSFVPVYQQVLSFPVCFSRWGIKNFYVVFPYSVKERVAKTGIFQWLFIKKKKKKKSYCPNKWSCCWMPLLLHSRCPKPVQMSSLGTGTRLSYAQTLQTADSETNIQSSLLLRSWNKW
jgi:hypothetical protein